jgi:CspA family cold shock protein
MELERGTITIWLPARSFGFAARDNGERDVLVHREALPPGRGALAPGERIEFDVVERYAKPCAVGVRVL